MTLIHRLRYSLYLAAFGGAVLVVLTSVADAVGALPFSTDKFFKSHFAACALSSRVHRCAVGIAKPPHRAESLISIGQATKLVSLP